MSRTAEELRAGAARLFQAQNPRLIPADNRARYDARQIEQDIIGECPGHDGTMLVVAIRWPRVGERMTLLSQREFVIGPSGERWPSKYGISVDSRVVPMLATFIGGAMDVLEEAERHRRPRGDRR